MKILVDLFKFLNDFLVSSMKLRYFKYFSAWDK